MVGVGAANHVDVQIGNGVRKGKHRVIGVVFAAEQTFFFTHHIHEQHAASRTEVSVFAQLHKLPSQLHHRHRARAIIVCPVVNFAVDDPHVVVV